MTPPKAKKPYADIKTDDERQQEAEVREQQHRLNLEAVSARRAYMAKLEKEEEKSANK
jgi:hypothetical protein